MNSSLTLVLAVLLVSSGSSRPAQASVVPVQGAKVQLVHFSIINMSGKLREVHVRGSVISLPIAKAVVFQAPAGECVRVLSSTDSKFLKEIVVSSRDEGRVLPVS